MLPANGEVCRRAAPGPRGRAHVATSMSDMTASQAHSASPAVPASVHQISVLLYSDDVTVRDAVRLAVGRRPAKNVEVTSWLECATHAAVVEAVDNRLAAGRRREEEGKEESERGRGRQGKSESGQGPEKGGSNGRGKEGGREAGEKAEEGGTQQRDQGEREREGKKGEGKGKKQSGAEGGRRAAVRWDAVRLDWREGAVARGEDFHRKWYAGRA